jgi:uncharacterized DUF497 family protein
LAAADFIWDEAKKRVKIAKHGIDFRRAILIFEQPTLDRVDFRTHYGERRVNSLGLLGQEIIVNVTYTDRDGLTRLISARLANRAERALYREFAGILDRMDVRRPPRANASLVFRRARLF